VEEHVECISIEDEYKLWLMREEEKSQQLAES
jgi:hypothetical protein